MSSEGPLEERCIPVLQGRILPKLQCQVCHHPCLASCLFPLPCSFFRDFVISGTRVCNKSSPSILRLFSLSPSFSHTSQELEEPGAVCNLLPGRLCGPQTARLCGSCLSGAHPLLPMKAFRCLAVRVLPWRPVADALAWLPDQPVPSWVQGTAMSQPQTDPAQEGMGRLRGLPIRVPRRGIAKTP